MNNSAETGVVFDIKKYSVHDGPGIRTTVFLKGCPLSCWWCHNPESQAREPEISISERRCVACGACVSACPQGAIAFNRRVTTDLARCTRCGICVDHCYADARQMVGREMGVTQVLAEIERDVPFYDESGGGVTFSGGEPLLQPRFLLALLQACQAHGIHTALDTSGYASWGTLDGIRPFVDLFLYDLKHLDDDVHRQATGMSNALILENLRRLSEGGHRIFLRVPLIPGVNDGEEHLRRLGAFAATLPHLERVDLLPYHAIAVEKYRRFHKVYPLPETVPPAGEQVQWAAQVLQSCGLSIHMGG